MKIRLIVLLVIVLGTLAARGQEVQQRERIAAATANAMESLRQQVGEISIARTLTVKQLLDRVGGQDELNAALARAQQIGGPRWLDDQTLQVRLEISGARVGEAIRRAASNRAKQSPVSVEYVSSRLRDWDRRTFSAVGTSTGSGAAESIRPTSERGGWSCIEESQRRKAIVAARADAVSKALEAIKPIPLTGGATVGDALAVAGVRQRMEQWLSERPISRVEFGADRDVKLTLGVSADEMFETFVQAAREQKAVALPADEGAWSAVRQQLVARVWRVSGSAKAPAATMPAVAAVQLPPTAPDWVNRQIDSEGAGKSSDSPLKAARAAESAALARLREQVERLPLSNQMNLAQASARDPRVAHAVDRAMERAQTYKVKYDADGGAKVQVSLDLRRLWEELRALP